MKEISILTIDLGTYCDNTLLLNCINYLNKEYNIICLSDEKHELPSDIIKYTYKTPEFLLKDTNIELADPHQSVMYWAIMNPGKALEAANWTSSMQTKIINILKKHKTIKKILILYPVFPILIQLPLEIFTQKSIYILYSAPAFPNKNVHWIFDSKIKDPDFKIYTKNKQHEESTIDYFNRIAFFSNQSLDSIINKFLLINHIIAWDNKAIKNIIPTIKGMKINKIGAIIDWPIEKPLPPMINYLLSNKKIIFITFGSYSNHIINNMNNLLTILEKYCKKENNTHIIFHNGNYNNEYITSYSGYIPYHKIVKKSILVVFTGSICLQNICLYHKVPMLFVPILTEQYFWAKNYKYFTGINFYDFNNNINIEKIINNIKCKKYLYDVSKNMHSYDYRKKLIELIKN
jgi:hypothetical protein